MSKIKLNDDINDIIVKLSDGNPGAMSMLFGIIKHKEDDFVDLLSIFLTIDKMGLYGSHLYMLWNDCCNRDTEKTIQVIYAYQKGLIKESDIIERIKNVGYGRSFNDLLGVEDNLRMMT